ncbi:MAG: MaoC family dehydratase [Halioglobus sp.]|nr:MaoC family dehydratase [Halioglobus sp.]
MSKPTIKLHYADINEGDEAPVVSHELTRTCLVKYAGASGDFNPMHTDEVKAKEAGLPGVFGHGMFSMGLLGRALSDWAGAGNLKQYGVRFTRQTWPGETLSTKIVVTGKEETDEGKLVAADVSLANQDGEVKLSGNAKVLAG